MPGNPHREAYYLSGFLVFSEIHIHFRTHQRSTRRLCFPAEHTELKMESVSKKKPVTVRAIISVLLIAIVMLGAVGVFEWMRRSKPQVAAREVAEAVYNVDVFQADPRSFTELLVAFGTAAADREVVLAAQVTGEITEVHPQLRVGQQFSPGRVETSASQPSQRVDPDILLRIDPRDYEQRVQQTSASIATLETEIEQLNQQQANATRQLTLAKQDLETLQADYDRVKSLRDRGAGSASDLSRSLLELRRYEDTIVQLENQITLFPHQIDAAQERLAGSRSDLQRAQNDLKRTVLTAPFRGILGEVMIEQGQYVRSGEPLVRLIDPDRIDIPVSIGFDDYMVIQDAILKGEHPRAWLAENETAGARWTGRIVRVAPSADAASRTIEVYIEVVNSEQTQPLLPGTFVFAGIEGPFHSDALVVPREAIVDGRVYVVDKDGIAKARTVTTGRRLQQLVLVSAGIEKGDRIILTNLDVIRDGTRVIPQGVVSPDDEISRMRIRTIRLENL